MMKKEISLFVLLLLSTATFAQEKPAMWFELEFKKEITSKLDFELVPEYRLSPELEWDEYFIEAGIQYELFKFLKVGGAYRFYQENKKKNDETGHRYIFDVKPELEIDRFELQWRIRYISYFKSEDVDEAKPYLRYRLKVKYNIKKSDFEPYAHVETYQDLKKDDFTKIRYTGGLNYEITNRHSVSLFYRYQDFWEKEEVLHIVGFGYSLDL
jgi:hypothetical protein